MPRVHGIDTVPRRGGRRRADPASNFRNAIPTPVADRDSDRANCNGASLGAARVALEGSSTNGESDLLKSAASASPSPFPDFESQGSVKRELVESSNILEPIQEKITAKNEVLIQPQTRESLRGLEFQSHSFSTCKISQRKSVDIVLASSFVGLAPSIERPKEKGKMAPSESLQPSAEKNIVSDTVQLKSSEHYVDTATDEGMGDEGASDAGTDGSNDDSSAAWLYHRCCLACTKMETPLSALDLAIETHRVIRSITDDEISDHPDYFQQKLFAMIKDGKRRDLDFVFDVFAKAIELRGDRLLSEERLREVASLELSNSSEKITNTHVNQRLQNASATEGGFILQIPPEKHAQALVPNDSDFFMMKHRSRRRKHPTRNKAQGFPHYTEKHTEAQDLDMQDDKKWTFLPQALLQATKERNEEVCPSTRRITRSMGINIDGEVNINSEEPVAEKTAQSIDARDKVTGAFDPVNDSHLISETKPIVETEQAKQAKSQGINIDGEVNINSEEPVTEMIAQNIDIKDKVMEIDDVFDPANDSHLIFESKPIVETEQAKQGKSQGINFDGEVNTNSDEPVTEKIAQNIDAKDKVMEIHGVFDPANDAHLISETKPIVKTEQVKQGKSQDQSHCSEEESVAKTEMQSVVQDEAVEKNYEYTDKEIVGGFSSNLEKQLAGDVNVDVKAMGMDGAIDYMNDSQFGSEHKLIAESKQEKQHESEKSHAPKEKSIVEAAVQNIGNQDESVKIKDETKLNIDKKIYSVAKTRHRSEFKETIIIFTGIIATHKHMQVSRSKLFLSAFNFSYYSNCAIDD